MVKNLKKTRCYFCWENSDFSIGSSYGKSHIFSVISPGAKKKNLKLGGNVDRSSGIYKEGTRVYQNPVVTTPGTWVHSDHWYYCIEFITTGGYFFKNFSESTLRTQRSTHTHIHTCMYVITNLDILIHAEHSHGFVTSSHTHKAREVVHCGNSVA